MHTSTKFYTTAVNVKYKMDIITFGTQWVFINTGSATRFLYKSSAILDGII